MGRRQKTGILEQALAQWRLGPFRHRLRKAVVRHILLVAPACIALLHLLAVLALLAMVTQPKTPYAMA